jgi:hypothetical protein
MHILLHALSPGILMDIDHTQTLKPIAQTCYCCGQTSHINIECDLHHDVCHMMLNEQDEFIQQVMANCDVAMTAAAESMTQMGTSEGTLVERKLNDLDFARSSR